MLRQKTNIRKTKSGNVIKEVKEMYLRRNISCGIQNCIKCYEIFKNTDQKNQHVDKLDPNLYVESTLNNQPYVIIPSMCVIDSQIDILEDKRIKNVIICQTVLDTYKSKNRQLYQKLINILTAPDKHFFQFYNEFHADIYIQKLQTESVAERNDRCFQNTYIWYANHIMSAFGDKLKVIVLTLTDKEADDLRTGFNLNAYSIHDYVKSLVGMEDLVDKINSNSVNESVDINKNSSNTENFIYPPHLSLSQLQSGIRMGLYLKGIFHSSCDNYKEATVRINEETQQMRDCTLQSIHISGIINMNRAFDGDVVVVEILPDKEWVLPLSKIEEDNTPNTLISSVEDSIEYPGKEIGTKINPCGKVVGIIKRNWKQYCGTLQVNELNTNSIYHLFRPLKKTIPWINIETRRAKDLCGKRICVAVDSWPRNSRYPLGHYLTTLGDLGDKNVETDTILTEEGIRFQPFSKSVLNCLPNMDNPDDWNPDAILLRQPFREDLRSLDVCSIDPLGCTDIDDALHCRLLSPSELPDSIRLDVYEVGVHIADVTHFITPGTAIDDEAYTRGTTVYLTDRRIDMIPELLSSNLCSLRENEDRLAFSVRWYLDAEANFVNEMPPKFCKSVIRSRRAFTYNEAQAILDDPNDSSTLGYSIKMLANFAKKFRASRINNGAIMLASSEIRFEMDQERNEPLELQEKGQIETNRLVEDFMLLANITVAKKLYHHFPSCSILRCHPRPEKGSFKPICDLLKDKFGVSDAKIRHIEENLKALLDIASDYQKDKYIDTLLRILSTRCLSQALYFCSGACSENDFHHFGLAESIYTHFTSPIRRYPDILVHRLLSASLGIVNEHSVALIGMPATHLQSMCDHLNKRNRSARLASWSSLKLHTVLFVKKSPNGIVQENAYVLQLSENAIRVYIPRFGKEGTIYLDAKSNRLTDDLDKSSMSKIFVNPSFSRMCFEGLDITIEKLQRVVVQMAVKQTEACHIDSLIFLLVEPVIPGLSVSPIS